jgi:arginyl-tRNA synthetase
VLNPIGELREECRRLLLEALDKAFPVVDKSQIILSSPPSPELGDLSSSICFQLSKELKRNPKDLAETLVSSLDRSSSRLLGTVQAVGGYVNFHADLSKLAEVTLESVEKLDEEYGFLKVEKPMKTIVEHTSANPNGPIHIGTARNAILGDSLARIVEKRGHSVRRHFYVDDMGRQVAMAAYGWKLLGQPEPEGEPDLYVGFLYASVNCINEVGKLKKQLEDLQDSTEERGETLSKLDEYTAAAQALRERNTALFDLLAEKMAVDPAPDLTISKINTDYERGVPEVKRLIMGLVSHALKGFERSLGSLGITFDSWDYESSYVWDGGVNAVLAALRETPYVHREEGALLLDCDGIARDFDLKRKWKINENYDVPPLVLVRADGTTLYTTRDIPYTLWKFGLAERVINVVGFEQTLPQLQLRIALVALRKLDIANRLVHFAYEFVRLPEFKMGRRMGRYITLMEVVERAVSLAQEEVEKRPSGLIEEQKREISRMVGIGAVKYILLSIDPMRPVVFTWERALDFERNSAPFIQYAHARACNILKKAGEEPAERDYSLLGHPLERELVMMIAKFPETFASAAEDLKPNEIAEYANLLADKFNSFYAALSVIKAEPAGLSGARLALVNAVRIVLRNALDLLRIGAPERM